MASKDEEDMTYNNDSIDVTMASGTFDEVLEKNKSQCEEKDWSVRWYHGKISRSEAEKLLMEAIKSSPGLNMDGVFLVRDSSNSNMNFSLSLLHDTRCYHFFIKQAKKGCYCIEGGPTIHGLEELIAYYIDNAGQLPTRLRNICRGNVPPPEVRKIGVTNLLHSAVDESREDIVAKILQHPCCPDVNAKNSKGSTALHDACSRGLDKIVDLLLQKDLGSMKMVDVEGHFPLHKAASANHAKVCSQLITKDYGCVQEKNPYTGMVPLHMAAMLGHYDCIVILLKSRAALYPRTFDDETPIDLAVKYERNSCLKILESSKETKGAKGKQEWLHPNLDRQNAENLMKEHNISNGLFLMRPSRNNEMEHVLSVCHEKSVRHYVIEYKVYRSQPVYFMDNGPYHPSLEVLVQFYHLFDEGLQVKLKNYVSSEFHKVEDFQVPEIYANIPRGPKVAPLSPLQVKPKPVLPPRPSSPTKTSVSPTVEMPQDLLKELSEKNSKKEVKPKPGLPPRPSTPPKTPVVETQLEPLKEISVKNLKKGCELGQGEYGSVLKGVLIDKKKTGMLRKEVKTDVAIKTFHSVNNMEDFKQEAHTMQSLKHEYIVELLGVCYGPPMMLVEEFLPMGSMLDYLEDHPQKIKVKRELYLWAAQIARGMVYLETKRLVHRDLAARNILLKSLHHLKISDFGLSRAMGSDKEYYKASKGGRWPIKWYAPESVNFGHFDHATDVWGYGVTLWEMFSYGKAPFEDMTGVEVIKYIEDGNRLNQPKQCPNAAYAIMKKCWSQNPQDRPTFTWLNHHFNEDSEYASAQEMMEAARQGR